ncbi:hypothetical protein RHMOL_Rhmol13G0301100 [Rhododendron molle]|uniref:Uncharacterized protein n=2 Tax=Rhododendron molle TaxID=49168 RepID=A0ACC0LDM0_RHOML|nr:hypothetical protein RHMOL_Rhmol13G0300800 [Rhododendron molle]KAI8526356.1 hypothetical protein RHMOL_Rhmol13G0301100 [Rhododendron molle]
MEIGTVLYQQDVEGIPQLPRLKGAVEVQLPNAETLKGAVEVQLPNADVDATAKFAVYEYNKKQGTHLEFVSTLAGYAARFPLGTVYAILFKAKDGGKTKIYFAAVLVTPLMKFLMLFVHIFG